MCFRAGVLPRCWGRSGPPGRQWSEMIQAPLYPQPTCLFWVEAWKKGCEPLTSLEILTGKHGTNGTSSKFVPNPRHWWKVRERRCSRLVHTSTYPSRHEWLHTQKCTHVRKHIHTNMHACVHAVVHVFIYIWICIYRHTKLDKHTCINVYAQTFMSYMHACMHLTFKHIAMQYGEQYIQYISKNAGSSIDR